MKKPSDLPQYIAWKSVPNRDGEKPLKVPVHHQTGEPCDPLLAANWTTFEEAERMYRLIGATGVGFVLTTADSYVCLDLDACLQDDGTRSQFALEILGRFPGAYVERSFSGNGLHIWFQATLPPGHRTRRAEVPGLEVYSQKRFIALGDHYYSGDTLGDHTAGGTTLLEDYLPGNVSRGGEWTHEPVSEWNGPTDDDELIRKMLASRPSAAAAFGDGATVGDLWHGRDSVLAGAHPSAGVEAFDHSAADMALMAHLAFWTGKDCARMDRLFRLGLVTV